MHHPSNSVSRATALSVEEGHPGQFVSGLAVGGEEGFGLRIEPLWHERVCILSPLSHVALNSRNVDLEQGACSKRDLVLLSILLDLSVPDFNVLLELEQVGHWLRRVKSHSFHEAVVKVSNLFGSKVVRKFVRCEIRSEHSLNLLLVPLPDVLVQNDLADARGDACCCRQGDVLERRHQLRNHRLIRLAEFFVSNH